MALVPKQHTAGNRDCWLMQRRSFNHRAGGRRIICAPRCGGEAPGQGSGPKRPPPAAPGPLSKGFSLLEWTNAVLPQGQLVSGVQQGWRAAWAAMVRELAPQSREGQYSRPAYSFAGRIGQPRFPPESGRYQLYLGNACPWCHRVALAGVLRGHFRPSGWREEGQAQEAESGAAGARVGQGAPAEQASSSWNPSQGGHRQARPRGSAAGGGGGRRLVVGFTRLTDDPTKARRGGWVFSPDEPDPVFGAADLWQVYDTCQPGFRGRCTAPLLLDAGPAGSSGRGGRGPGGPTAAACVVSNESADIVASLDALHLPGCSTDVTLRPRHLEAAIDELNRKIYSCINNGVYRSGFATSQQAYDAAQADLWSALDEMEDRLQGSRFLLGDRLTESDVWLFPTVIRLDAAYGPLFKCGRRRVFGSGSRGGGGGGDYPALAGWARDIWQLHVPGSRVQIRDTLDLDAARVSYFRSLFPLNPGGIVPAGPTAADLRLELPAGRGAGSTLADVCHSRVAE